MRIYDRRNELMPRQELEQLQLERLQALLGRLKRSVRRYREMLGEVRVESLDAMKRLPLTTPEDLADSFPYGMFALPLREVIRLHSTVGPQGKPLVVGYTRNDLAQWGRLVARQLVASGVTAHDIIQMSLGGNVLFGAAGFRLGAEQIEASIIAEEPLHIEYQLAMLQSYRPTILVTTPLNASRLMRELEQRRIDPQSFSLRTILLSRPVSEEMRSQLHAGLFADVRCCFGVGDVMDPGLCVECEAGQFHANEDQFLTEVVDGELVITTLNREAMPLLRYRTRIACEMNQTKCTCGRTGGVLKPGVRMDGRFLIAETPIHQCQIEQILAQNSIERREFRYEVKEDHLEVEVLVTAERFGDTMRTIERLRGAIESEFQTRFGIEARVKFTTKLQPEGF